MPQTAIFGLFSTELESAVTSFDLALSLPSITGRANSVPISNRLFMRLIVSAVEAPKVTQISITER